MTGSTGNQQRVMIDKVNWRKVFPWLALSRSFRMALGPGKLVLACVALLATSVGWWAIGAVFSGSNQDSVVRIRESVHWPWRERSLALTDFDEQFDPRHPLNNIVLSTATYYVRPGQELFGLVETNNTYVQEPVSLTAFLLAGLKTLWMIAVWTILGGAIARIAVVEFTQDRRVSMMEGLGYALGRWRAFVGAPAVMLIGILVAAVPVMIVGLISYPGGFFYALSGLIWPVALVFGLIMGVLALGLLFGWPLMSVAVAAEREEDADAFGAISRAFEYGYQHIFKYLLYILFAVVIGGVSWLIVTTVAERVLQVTAWGASWGAPGGGEHSIEGEMLSLSQLHSQGEIDRYGSFFIRCWTGVIQTTVVGFAFTFFWSAAAGIYVLLRNHAENVPLSEVYLPETEEPGLPPYDRDSAGVPVVSHEMPVSDDVPAADAATESNATENNRAENGDNDAGDEHPDDGPEPSPNGN